MSGFPGAYIKDKSTSNLCSTSGQKLLTRKSNPFTVGILEIKHDTFCTLSTTKSRFEKEIIYTKENIPSTKVPTFHAEQHITKE
jgi:hypothetical protein